MNVPLNTKAAARLNALLTAYVTALQTTVDALGLDGEWTYDATTGSLTKVEKED